MASDPLSRKCPIRDAASRANVATGRPERCYSRSEWLSGLARSRTG